MDKEFDQLQSLFSSEDVIIQKSGIGKVNAALQTAKMISEYHPDAIISSGCAGGNGDDINVQDVVVSSQLAYHDVYCGEAIGKCAYGQVQGLPPRFEVDKNLLLKAFNLNKHLKDISVHPGLIVTGDWFVDTKEKMREIIRHFPEARAVDMESAAIAHTCYIYKVPFISFRVISDIPLRDTNAAMYHNFWDTIAENSFQVTKTFIESL